MDLSIIIINFNTKNLLKKCINSIKDWLNETKLELIIVDNGSTDGSIDEVSNIKYQKLKIKIIENKQNLGFAKACNIGFREAKGKFILFLNSDAILKDNHVLKMINYLDINENVSIAGGLLLNSDGTLQRSYGNFYNLFNVLNMLIFGDKKEIEDKNKIKIKKVDWVSGGFMMVRNSVFRKLEGFDENFFMYIEDMEFCYRAKKSGFMTYLYPHASVIHISQGSSSRSFAIEYIYKGLAYFFRKHKSRIEFKILVYILKFKAALLITGGVIFNNSYLKDTYTKAIRF